MALLQFTVWDSAAEVANGPVKTEGTVAIGGTSVQSSVTMEAAAGNRGRRVRLFADLACWVTWGLNPTAISDGSEGRALGAENPEYFDIPANFLLATIQRT